MIFFLQHYTYVGDSQIPLALKMFIDENGRELVEKNLYKNFLLHISNLFEFGVLPPGNILFVSPSLCFLGFLMFFGILDMTFLYLYLGIDMKCARK